MICLQETKLAEDECKTTHYNWILGLHFGKTKIYRGLAILVHHSCSHMIRQVHNVSHNILACDSLLDDNIITILNVHIHQGTNGDIDFNHLHNFVSSRTTEKLIICGDFNAHLGKLDLTADDKKFVGPNLFHDHCNDNGENLLNLIHFGEFSVHNSWQRSRSLRVTWTNGTSLSQIDHVLCNSVSHDADMWLTTR